MNQRNEPDVSWFTALAVRDRIQRLDATAGGVPLFEALDLPDDEESVIDENFHDKEAPHYQAYCEIPRTKISEAWLLDWIQERTPEGIVLDLGSGTGRVAEHLASSTRRVIAVDRSAGMLEYARESFPPERGVALRSDIRNLPVKDGTIDGIVCSGVLHHLPEWRRALREAARVLRPGGRLIVREPNARYAGNLFEPAEKLMNWLATTGRTTQGTPEGEPQEGLSPVEEPLSPEHLVEAAKAEGFDVATLGSAMFLGSLGIPGESAWQGLYFQPANLVDRLMLRYAGHDRGALLLSVLVKRW
ncbi:MULTISPECIES: class I SAM-dependent methyltransferase [unclassified Streptomyces]|uniref:class I SAM-dependent methyltransferase n=1 Tax=unclassified Streptomyces TaxID=2593676 RepID=UPI0037A2F2FB